MKKQLYFTALLALTFFTGKAQSGKLEIGLTGGTHFHNNASLLNENSKQRFDLIGGFYTRYVIRPKWKIGIDVGAESWSFKSPIQYTDLNANPIGEDNITIYEASPMLSIRGTVTRILHTGKWQTAVTLKAGYAKGFKKDVSSPAKSSTAWMQTELSLPTSSGFTAGLQVEESRMITNRLGAMATIGVNYYRIKWDAPFSGTDNLVSAPVQIGLFVRM